MVFIDDLLMQIVAIRTVLDYSIYLSYDIHTI